MLAISGRIYIIGYIPLGKLKSSPQPAWLRTFMHNSMNIKQSYILYIQNIMQLLCDRLQNGRRRKAKVRTYSV